MQFSVATCLAFIAIGSIDAFGFSSVSRIHNRETATFTRSLTLNARFGSDLGSLESKLLTSSPIEVKETPKEKTDREKREKKTQADTDVRVKAQAKAKAKADAGAAKAEAVAAKKSKATKSAAPVTPAPVPVPVPVVEPAPVAKKTSLATAAPKIPPKSKTGPVGVTKTVKPKTGKSKVTPKNTLSLPKSLPSLPSLPKTSLPKISLPKIPLPKTPKAADPALADDNAILGVALGVAPLLAVPVVGLAALRNALSATQARRSEIQKGIDEAEKARLQRQIATGADGQALVPALGLLSSSSNCSFNSDSPICGYA